MKDAATNNFPSLLSIVAVTAPSIPADKPLADRTAAINGGHS